MPELPVKITFAKAFPLLFLMLVLLFIFNIQSCMNVKAESAVKRLPSDSNNLAYEVLIDNYNNHLKSVVDKKLVPGLSAVIVKNGETLLKEGYGYRDLKRNLPVTPETVFRIGSLSKGLNATLAAILTNRGLISFEDNISSILPTFELSDKNQGKRIKLWHLLSHSTGLPYHTYTNLVEAGLPIERIIKEFPEVSLIKKEGELCAYQNAAFSVLEPYLFKKTEKKLPDLLNEYMFKPLNMCTASTDYQSIINAKNFSEPYRKGKNKFYKRKISNKYYNAIPAGGINASANDMEKYLKLLLGNYPEILDDLTRSSFLQDKVPTPGTRYFDKWADNKSTYGLGWRFLSYKGRKLAYHGGFVNGYRSEIALDLENNIGICLLMNASVDYAKRSIPTFLDYLQSYSQD